MNNPHSATNQVSGDQMSTQLTITRVFDAPRELVWKAWTEPDMIMKWWSPAGYTAPMAKVDFKVGGKYLMAMRSPEGQDFYSTGIYTEVVPMDRIVFTDSFADADGNVVSAAVYGMGDTIPLESRVIVQFEDQGSKTRMTLTHSGLPQDEHLELTKAGWNDMFDKLDQTLKR